MQVWAVTSEQVPPCMQVWAVTSEQAAPVMAGTLTCSCESQDAVIWCHQVRCFLVNLVNQHSKFQFWHFPGYSLALPSLLSSTAISAMLASTSGAAATAVTML